MRSRTARAALAVVLLFLTAACTAPEDSSEPVVYVTTNILGDVVEQVVGDQADVVTLMRPNSDPHSFEISAQQADAMGRAALVVSNGVGLEEGLQQHLDRVRDDGVTVFAAGDHVTLLPYTGEAAGSDDPHFWTDPGRMRQVVEALQGELAAVDGIDSEALVAGTNSYLAQLDELEREMEASFGRIPEGQKALVTNHHVFGYLAERFGFRLVGAAIPGGTTLAAPSAADLKELAEAIESAGVPAIFAESSQPDRLMQVLASEVGLEVEVVELFTESLTEPDGEAGTYLSMMRANTERITAALSRQRPN
ncbi:zinc ABC transporter substrate-binding protein AztC [Tessaracoccus terricola]